MTEFVFRKRPARRSGAYLVYRSRVILGLTLGIANFVGALVIFLFAAWILPPDITVQTGTLIRWNAIAAAIYISIATPIGVLWGRHNRRDAENWLLEGREPTRTEVRTTLRAPHRLTFIQATLWVVAAVGFALVNGIFSPLLIGRVAIIVVCGGLSTSALTFLLVERIDRPIVARALAHDPNLRRHATGVTSRTLLVWAMGTGIPLFGIVVAGINSLATKQGTRTQLAVAMTALGATGMLLGFTITLLGARSVAVPVRAVRRAMGRIEDGDLDVAVEVNTGTEVGLLQAGFNQMATGLRDRERIRDLFGRQVGDDVARAALDKGLDLLGETRGASVLFVDVVASTGLTTTRSPREVLALLNRFFAVVVDVVDDHGGWINKFIGDAAMAVFGTPEDLTDHAGAALRAARTLAARLAEDVGELDFGIGVSTGSVVAGHLGDARRYEYTIIGDSVNVASRLTDQAKREPHRVLVDARAVHAAAAEEPGHWSIQGLTTIRGRTAPLHVAVPTFGLERPVPPREERRAELVEPPER